MITAVTRGPGETRALGAALAELVEPGDVILLVGGLGAGKTTFVQGLAAGLGWEGEVTSPTFTLCHAYAGRLPLIHADLWRIDTTSELLDLSFDEELEDGSVLVAEWGEAAEGLFGQDALEITFVTPDVGGADEVREVAFEPHGDPWLRRAGALDAAVRRSVGSL